MKDPSEKEREALFASLNKEMEDIGVVNERKKGEEIMPQVPPLTAKERMEIDLEEEREFYRSWEACNKILWEAIQRSKMRMAREIKRLRIDLQKALEEKESAVEELAKARRTIEKIIEDIGVKREK